MNIGTVAYTTNSGLGILAKQFYQAGLIDRIMTINHPRYQSHPEWYPKECTFNQFESKKFFDKLSSIIIFENAFGSWNVVANAKRQGIKFILVPMYEWTPKPLPVEPDLVICPSLIEIDYFKQYRHIHIPIPAPDNRDIPFKLRVEARTFVHNAGHGQVGYAKGTPEVLEAMSHVRSPIRLIVRGQTREKRIDELFQKYRNYSNIEIQYGEHEYSSLFSTGDVYINAERYNGLSLPLQEAFSSGMMVMTSNRFPANTWLPNEPMIRVSGYHRHRVNQTDFDMATIDPIDIAETIDKWYGKDITSFSLQGKKWAEENSWEKLLPKYLEAIGNV